VPDAIPEIVILVPVPAVVSPSGLRVSIHIPVAGKPLSATLPVGIKHVGLVIVPITGVEGIAFTDNA
jgi:hypothetical protein